MSYIRALGVSAVALAALLAGSTASHASEASASSTQLPQSRSALLGTRPAYARNQVIVRYDRDTSSSRIATIRRSVGTRSTSPLISRMELLQLPSGASVTRAVRELDALPGVSYAQPNHRRYPMATMPNDSDFGNLWGLNNTGQAIPDLFTGRPVTGTVDADIDAPEAWDITTGSDTVKVAVLDTGVAWRHEDLAGNIWRNPGEVGLDGGGADKRTNRIDDDANGYKDDWHGWDFYDKDNDPDDDFLHGSHVAGTIGGSGNNTTGITGVAWDVSIVPLRFLGDEGGTEADAIKAYKYAAANGVDIVNGSFGGRYSSKAERDAIAAAKDVLFVFAAGNDGENNDLYASFPANYASTLPNVISVGASSFRDGRAFFSNYGATTVDLAAPGSRTYSTMLQKASLSDSFDEDTTGRWTNGGTRNRWEWTSIGRFYSSNSWEGKYLNNTNSWASPAPMDLTGMTSCELSFFTYYALEKGRDFLKVETSVDAGASWQQLGQLTGYNIKKVTYDLAAFDNVADLRVRFRLVTNSSGVDEGFHFTEFQLTGCDPSTWDYDYLDGTSMATPHVAGAAALLLSEHPGADPAWLRKMLNDGTDAVPGWAGKSKTGGRLNARGALDEAVLATDPIAFTASSPTSGATVTDRTPTFTWQASGADSGIDEYHLYVDGALTSTITDQATTKTPGNTLAYGLHEWWVVAVDNDADTAKTAHGSFYVKRLPTLRLYQGSRTRKSCGASLSRACTYRAGRTVTVTGFAGPRPEFVGSTVTLNFYKRSSSGGWNKEFTRNPPLNDPAGSVADIFTSPFQARRGTWKVEVRVSPTEKTLVATGHPTYLVVR